MLSTPRSLSCVTTSPAATRHPERSATQPSPTALNTLTSPSPVPSACSRSRWRADLRASTPMKSHAHMPKTLRPRCCCRADTMPDLPRSLELIGCRYTWHLAAALCMNDSRPSTLEKRREAALQQQSGTFGKPSTPAASSRLHLPLRESRLAMVFSLSPRPSKKSYFLSPLARTSRAERHSNLRTPIPQSRLIAQSECSRQTLVSTMWELDDCEPASSAALPEPSTSCQRMRGSAIRGGERAKRGR